MAVPESLLLVLRQYAAQDYRTPLDLTVYAGTEYEELAALVLTIAKHASAAQQEEQTFVSNVAHELRTPVTILRGFADGLSEGTIPKAERAATLAILSQETRRLEAMITSMLQLTRLEKGTLQLQCDWFVLNDLVFHTLFMFQNRLEKRRITIEGLDGVPMRIYADRDLMGQVVFNLIENAVKFVDTGGTITFGFSVLPETWVFSIRNTGAGISEEGRRRLFERFYQFDASQSKDRSGLGIGLDLVRRLVALHHGTITVQSEVDVYTAFEIRLPRQADLPNACTSGESQKE